MALIVFMASCGGGKPVGLNQPPAGPPAVNLQDGADKGLLNVRMNPQKSVTPAFKSASLVQPHSLLNSIPMAKSTAEADDVVTTPASQFTNTLPFSRVDGIGDYLEFSPAWENGSTQLGDLAYCIYEFNFGTFPNVPTFSFHWNESYAPEEGQMLYLGFSDWDGDQWVWFEGQEDGTVTLTSYDAYTSQAGSLLVVAALTGKKRCLLESIALGVPEERSTGDLGDEPPPTSDIPPLYVPALPSSVDLSDECAPINDQLTWGACTAFAVGDGAYNYELGQIYGGLGWDLTDDFNRVSPKYLYVTSGVVGGFPAGGEYGRWTYEVAEVLRTYGVSSEQNAPYDLEYNSNWSAAAEQDAGLLDITEWWPVPCHSNEGIDSIKAVLAHLNQLVFFRTNLDYGFAFYEPGTVWTYTGPNIGGHAMCIVGYDDSRSAFKVRNSWSTDWGNDGHVWVHYASIKSYAAWTACWTLRDDYDADVAQHFLQQTALLAPPTGLEATRGTLNDRIDLTWQPVTGATGYKIYRDTRTNLIDTVGAVESYSDLSALAAYSHAYWVKAVDGPTESYFSSPAVGYLAQPPVIVSVSPAGGSLGQEVTFSANVYGSQPMEFSWNFGSGATPGTSSEPNPTVVLGAEGIYTFTLDVSNGLGSDQYEFEFNIGPNLDPGAYMEGDKAEGFAPLKVTFDASDSNDPDGIIILYEWWCDNGTPWEASTTDPVLVRDITELGTNDVYVRVTDNSGNTDQTFWRVYIHPDNYAPQASFSYSVNSAVPPYDVSFNASTSSDEDGEIVLYQWDYDGDGTVDESGASLTTPSHVYTEMGKYTPKLIVTDDDDATGETTKQFELGLQNIPAGWAAHVVDNFAPATGIGARLELIAGKPAFAVKDGQDYKLQYVYSDNDSPSSSTNWTRETIYEGDPVYNYFSLADINGEAAVVFKAGDNLYYSRRNGGSWTTHAVDAPAEGQAGQYCEIGMVNGKPAVLYLRQWTTDGDGFWFARATSATPASDADWVAMNIDPDADARGAFDMLDVGGIPVVSLLDRRSGQSRLAFAMADRIDPTATAHWSLYEIGTENLELMHQNLDVIDGGLAITFNLRGGTHGVELYRADSMMPTAAGNWTLQHVDPEGNASSALIVINDGYPVIAYGATARSKLALATTTDPGDIYDWTRNNFVDDFFNLGLLSVNTNLALSGVLPDSPVLYYVNQIE